jgi:APA family basic amino acid/polyamine antiporter
VAVVVALSDIRSAIGFSSFAVLTYYAIANASALRLHARERRWLAIGGLIGCAALALSLPPPAVLAGGALLLVGAIVFVLIGRIRR